MVAAVRSPVTAYAEAVRAGAALTGLLVARACARHLRDLETGHERGLWFDEAAAQFAIDFFAQLGHVKGEWARDPAAGIILEPWQCFIIGSLFGWKRADGMRRFRTAYVEVARKNAKSTMSAGVGLLLAFFDGEPGAEVYSAATKRDQAKIVWNDARQMVLRRPALRKRIVPFVGNLHNEATASKFEPLGADGDTMDGLNIHGAIVDELHAHPNRKIVDVLETGTGARRQPLIIYITTAGFDRHSVCWTHREYTTKILDGVVEDDTWFGYVATLDEGDSWSDPSVWVKANPNLGISVKLDDLERKCARAQQMPTEQQEFRRKHCNQWTESETRWLSLEAWDRCDGTIDYDDLVGRTCYGGLDLSTTTDLTSLALVFPPQAPDEPWKALSFSWVPEDSLRQRADRDRVPYPVWRDQGHLFETDGNVVDYDAVEAFVLRCWADFDLRELAIDRWNSTGTQTRLSSAGMKVVPFGQGFASMSAPVKELERLVLDRSLNHGGNPVLRWAATNAVAQFDAAENVKLAKDKSTERIDPLIALVMSLGRAMLYETSPYESDGLLVL